MARQIIYTPENPPTKGVAKIIWAALTNAGYEPYDLHYNQRKPSSDETGTWACALNAFPHYIDPRCGTNENEFWCGVCGKTAVWIGIMVAPYGKILIGYSTRICPFYKKYSYWETKRESIPGGTRISRGERVSFMGCACPSMGVKLPEKCESCENCTDEFLKDRNREYQKHKRV